MDVDESDAAGGGGSGSGGQGKAARGPDAGAATAEGIELLQQLIYSVFASAASRGLLTRTMVESGVVSAMVNDPMLTLVRQASTDKQCSVPRGYTHQSELSPHWQCYLLALRTTSDLTRTIHASKALSSPLASNAVAARWTAGVASSSSSSSSSAGGVSRERMGPREAEAGLSQVFRFVDAFRETMVEGLSLVVSAPPTGGGRLTLALVQESVDVAGVVAALGPWMSRWRAQHPGTSTQLLEAVRQATRTAAVLLVPAAGPPATKSAASGGGSAATGQTPVRGGGGGGGWSSPVARRRSLEEFTPMQQATPTPARGSVGGGAAITPARPIAGGGAVAAGATASGGGGGAAGGIADSRPLELVKAYALAVTAEEKAALDNGGGRVISSDGGGQYPCAMTMATPTPVHRGGGGGGGGGGGVAFAPLRAGVGGGGAAAGGLGFFGRVEDGITALLVLALSVLRRVSPQPKDMKIEVRPEDRGSIEAPVGAWIECKCRVPRRASNGDAQNASHGGGGGKGSTLLRSGEVIGRDMRGQGYLARFEATPGGGGGGGGGVSEELVPWEDVVAIKDPGAAIPIFSYLSLNSLPHLPQLHSHSPHGLLKKSSAAAAAAAGGAADSRGGGGVAKADEGGGVVFEGLYQEPSLGHLVGLVRYYVHQMETVSKEEDSAVGAGDIVSNDERNVRRWRLGQLGFITETALWMLVVNAVAHEGRAGFGGEAAGLAQAERRSLHDELLELFDTRLDEHASLWENLSRGEGGRAPVSISPAFVAHVKGMIQGWLDQARASKKERDATTPKSRAGKSGRRAVGGFWSPAGVGGSAMMRQASDMSVSKTPAIN
ncbi:unnamed protein product [Ectocarpus sp. 12 AP-2014]